MVTGSVKRICERCGKPLWKGIRFCSKECYFEWRSDNILGDKVHNWKGGKVERTCRQCSKNFNVPPSVIKQGGGKFCSRECWYKWRSINIRKEKVYNWKGGKIKCLCKICGEEFEINPSVLKVGGIYCSRSCARNAKKIPKHHTKPELIFEAICKKHNLPFHYIGDGSLWIGKEKALNPDFCELNGKKIVIEIMGDYWHSPLLNQNLRESAILQYRKRHYRKYKWQSIFLWESDIKRSDAEQFILGELKKNGVMIN